MYMYTKQEFRVDAGTCVMLISLKAGGEGLNLQVADHVFVVDPWWNPAAELQVGLNLNPKPETRNPKP